MTQTNSSKDPTDHLSHAFAYFALVPQFLLIVYATLILSTREIEIAMALAGQLACEAVNWVLKRHFKEERPERMRSLHRGYGMPSSHAQFLSFWAVMIVLFVWLRRRPGAATVKEGKLKVEGGQVVVNGVEKDLSETLGADTKLSDVYRLQLQYRCVTNVLITLGAVVSVVLMGYSRVYLHYHSTKQVMAGTAAGTAFAVFWFAVTEYARRSGWVEWFLQWDIVRAARARDLMCEEDLVEVGWQVWEERRRRNTRAAKATTKNTLAQKKRK